ncbi:MAG: hypothetical protein EA397_06975 [Deltaproteobacteria bacterium]|nr:MAG: hypothetical protein EA397_06975 [Deltaproteobacteria bacterium]
MLRTTLPVLLLAAACGPGLTAFNPEGAQQPDGTDDTDSADTLIGIDDLDPSFGPVEGGNPVSIYGYGFEGEVSVFFGQFRAEHQRLGPDRLIATAPAASQSMIVDVRVTSDRGTTTAHDAYHYGGDGPIVDSDSGSDSGGIPSDPNGGGTVTPTGLNGGLVELFRLQVACPACFSMTSDVIIDSLAVFHPPTSTSWVGWYPPSGSCVANPSRPPVASSFHANGEWANLQSGSANIAMRRTTSDRGPYYEATGLSTADFISNASYRLSVPDSGPHSGPFSVSGAVDTPQGFTTVEPEAMLMTSPSNAFSASISMFGDTLRWSPSGGSGTFLVVLDSYDYLSGVRSGQVVCYGPDNGVMNLPGTAMSALPFLDDLVIGMYRTRLVETTHPETGHTLQGIAQSGVLGTGYVGL